MRPARGRPAALVAVVAAATVLVAGCTGDPPGSPVQTIPKIIVDHVDNTTTVTLVSLGADVRYANMSLRLGNDNLTEPLVFTDSHAYALTAKTYLTFFFLNASADEGRSFYFYNASMHIVERDGTAGGDHPQWQIFIRDTPLGSVQTQTIPFTRLLEEGRQ